MNGEHDPVTPPTGWQFKKDETTSKPVTPEPSGVLEDRTSEPTAPLPSPVQLPPTIGSDDAHQHMPVAAAGATNHSRPSQDDRDESTSRSSDQTQSTALMADANLDSPSHHDSHSGEADRLEWTASDDDHQRPAGWTAMLIAGGLVLAALIYLITRDVLSAGSVVAATLLYGAFSAHKPPAVRYTLDAHGLVIGQKRYAYEQFRSFAVAKDGAASAASTVVLMPLKRFMPLLMVHYTAEMEDEIIAVFAERLPMEAYRRDAMDAIIKKLRF